MKHRIAVITVLFALLACLAVAQTPTYPITPGWQGTATDAVVAPTPPAVTLPTFINLTINGNQIGNPRIYTSFSAIYAGKSSLGLFATTTADIIPVLTVDQATKRTYYGISPAIRQGVSRVIWPRLPAAGAPADFWTTQKVIVTLGFGAGLGYAPTGVTSGVGVSFSGDVTGGVIYNISKTWALNFQIRGLYQNASWNLIPGVGPVIKP